MIQAITETGFSAYIQTEDNRINTAVTSAHIRHLFKFSNDMDKSIQYAYAETENIYNRYTKATFAYNATPNVYSGKIKFLPAGFWKYEVYEVSWGGTVRITEETAPSTETQVLEPSDDNGVVQGLVTKGKMFVSEKDGTQQIQYTQRQTPDSTNYIYYGQ